MDTLLTFTGFHDPYSKGLLGQEDQLGPILSLVRARPFDRIILFSTPNTAKISLSTMAALETISPQTEVQIIDTALTDPTDYNAILKSLRKNLAEIQHVNSGAKYFIAVASGTPQMHACWVLLASGGEIAARVLHIRPPRFVTKDQPLVTEVDLTGREFPTVRGRFDATDTAEARAGDIEKTVRQLGIVGDHPNMRKALETAAALGASDVPVLVKGETGTGKELIARLVHAVSGRPADRFVAINCAAIPAELVESILFGHKKGAFTGAVADQQGKFDQAHGGTLFLDELGELPLPAQAKLLRVLQDGVVEAIGDRKSRKVNVRIVAATNCEITKAIRSGKFREDLYFRLNVGEIDLPPLRDRRSDIPKIALHILDRVNGTLRIPKRLTQDALARMQSHNWPGNVRDLQNAIERSVLLTKKDILDADDLIISEPVSVKDPLETLPEPKPGFSMESFLGSARKQLILRALEIAKGNKSEAARLLGVTPQAVHKFVANAGDLNLG